jgi:mRNA-degrading endonuclease toxin of MazEF toxin-antitoxin module
MDLASAIRSAGLSRVELRPGAVCLVKDDIIRMPDGEANRTLHEFRTVIILSNDFLCASYACPLVTVVPTSSDLTRKGPAEIIIRGTTNNGFSCDSRVMLSHIQPLIKTDIEKKLGELNLDDWDTLQEQIVRNFDRA